MKVINPSTGEVLSEVVVSGPKEVESALSNARQAFNSGPWRTISLAQRREFLLKISEGIQEKAQSLAELETLNTGKPIKESIFMDIPSAAQAFEYCADHLEEFLAEEEINIPSGAQARLLRQPHGVVVLIVPWNYPLLIASWKLSQAMAAGNTVILKPSSLTPLTVLELGKIIQAAGLPFGVVNIVNGSGEALGRQLCADKRVDMISFTGSSEVGKKILSYSSENVKKTIMELGGKSAGIVLADADLEVAVNGSLCSIFLNQGQMCTAMSRILVAKEVYEDFIKDFTAKAQRIKLGKGMDCEAQMGPLISDGQRKQVIKFVENAIKGGAKILCGGKIPSDAQLKDGFFFEPTVFADVPVDMELFKEEVFGPVVCVNKFSSVDEAVVMANSSDFALANVIWTKDAEGGAKLAARINSGVSWVNTYGMFYNEVPFGGFKQSGFGKELGKEGFLEYTRLKNIIMDKTEGAKPLVNYWYGF